MGDMFKVIDDYTEMLCKELHKIVDENSLTPQNLEIGEIIAETCKDFEKYKMMKFAGSYPGGEIEEYYQSGGYNYGRYPDYMYQNNSSGSGNSYNRGYNGQNSNMNSSRNYGGYGTYNNSRGGNYGHEPQEIMQHTISELERVMRETPEGQARERIRQRIEELRRQNI